MMQRRPRDLATLAELERFDAILDVRSPAEFADDHIPGAASHPVLSDEERARVGTLYKQVSPFAARKIGAVLVARNLAAQIEAHFLDKPKTWRPLVYCWRGGQRSGAFTHVLREIGWEACRLEGGYKTWRRHVLDQLARLPRQFAYRVISGPTGSGKSRLLEALAAHGAQVLHLEQLAAHKGSVLGNLPDQAQPSQRWFETQLVQALARFDPRHPVFVEAESRKIGALQLPDALIEAMRAAPCWRLDVPRPLRAEFLLEDYAYFRSRPQWLIRQLGFLQGLQSKATLARWISLVEQGDFRTLVEELLEKHYDPLYARSQEKNYRYGEATVVTVDDLAPAALSALAARILAG